MIAFAEHNHSSVMALICCDRAAVAKRGMAVDVELVDYCSHARRSSVRTDLESLPVNLLI